jgi:universal stress protein A
MTRPRRVVHATDFSPASRAAFRHALELARGAGGALTLVHVLAPVVPPAGGSYALPQAYDHLQAEARAAARRQLDRLVARARAAGVRATGLVVEGVPASRIVDVARRGRAHLLVLGTHGRTGLARVALGSVAGQVLRQASCPVVTVRDRARGRRPSDRSLRGGRVAR